MAGKKATPWNLLAKGCRGAAPAMGTGSPPEQVMAASARVVLLGDPVIVKRHVATGGTDGAVAWARSAGLPCGTKGIGFRVEGVGFQPHAARRLMLGHMHARWWSAGQELGRGGHAPQGTYTATQTFLSMRSWPAGDTMGSPAKALTSGGARNQGFKPTACTSQ